MKRKKKKSQVANYLPSNTDFPEGVPQGVIQAVRGLYEELSHRHAQWPLNACVGCCMDESLAREMCDWKLRSITRKHIYQYQDAAHDTPQYASEYLHYLPRVAEFISQGDAGLVRHSTEIALDRLGRMNHSLLVVAEKQAIDTWCMAIWQWWLEEGGSRNFSMLREGPDALLIMFANAGLQLAPFLRQWQQSGTAWAAAQFGVLLADLEKRGKCTNAFASDLPDVSAEMKSWAQLPEVYLHFAEIWERMNDCEANAGLYGNHYLELSVTAQLGPRIAGASGEPLTQTIRDD